MSGSSIACVAAIGKLTLPTLEQQGYGRRFSVSLITATGVIDVIIPPSIPMIIYAITAQVSVTQLFLAGIVPGLMVACALSAYVMVRASLIGIEVTSRPQLSVVLPALRRSVWSVLAPVIILGGIYGGIFTPTEAAGIACIHAVAVSVLIHRELSWAQRASAFFAATSFSTALSSIASARASLSLAFSSSSASSRRAWDPSSPPYLAVLHA